MPAPLVHMCGLLLVIKFRQMPHERVVLLIFPTTLIAYCSTIYPFEIEQFIIKIIIIIIILIIIIIIIIMIIIIIGIYIAPFPFIKCLKALHIVIVWVVVNNASMREPEKVCFKTLLECLTRCRILQVRTHRIPSPENHHSRRTVANTLFMEAVSVSQSCN